LSPAQSVLVSLDIIEVSGIDDAFEEIVVRTHQEKGRAVQSLDLRREYGDLLELIITELGNRKQHLHASAPAYQSLLLLARLGGPAGLLDVSEKTLGVREEVDSPLWQISFLQLLGAVRTDGDGVGLEKRAPAAPAIKAGSPEPVDQTVRQQGEKEPLRPAIVGGLVDEHGIVVLIVNAEQRLQLSPAPEGALVEARRPGTGPTGSHVFLGRETVVCLTLVEVLVEVPLVSNVGVGQVKPAKKRNIRLPCAHGDPGQYVAGWRGAVPALEGSRLSGLLFPYLTPLFFNLSKWIILHLHLGRRP
jgi:hypothetical protein